MANYRIQHWPDMPGDGEEGDAIIFSDEWRRGDWERHKSWDEAWLWLAGNCEPSDRVVVMPPASGERDDSYAGEQDQWLV